MNLFSALVSNASDVRTGGVAVASALLATPALLVARAGPGAILLAVSFVAVAAVLEGRARAASRSREAPRVGLSVVSASSRSRRAAGAPRARWELVERDGQRSLSMRWS
ncbi:MAG TPA: hypothetical protein VMT11_01145 [Myxococcaceae bacterium]|nr:hypothetical protein [Myxococcaceae bacterium]